MSKVRGTSPIGRNKHPGAGDAVEGWRAVTVSPATCVESYFLEIFPGAFHIFPSDSMSQDAWMPRELGQGKFQCRRWEQKDGSRFPVLTAHRLSGAEMKYRLESSWSKFGVLYLGERLNADEIRGRLRRVKDASYVIVLTHRFIGSVRVVPIIADHELRFCYDLSVLFPALCPEDGWGVLLDGVGEISKLVVPEMRGLGVSGRLIEYLADKRLCSGCGRVYDIRKVYPVNWNPSVPKPVVRRIAHNTPITKIVNEGLPKKRGRPRKIRSLG